MLCSEGLPDGFTDLELADLSNIKEWNVRMLPVSLSVIIFKLLYAFKSNFLFLI